MNAKPKKATQISLNITNRLCKQKMENHIRRAMALKWVLQLRNLPFCVGERAVEESWTRSHHINVDYLYLDEEQLT